MWRAVTAAVLALTVLVYQRHVRTSTFIYEDANAAWNNAAVRGQQPIDVTRARWLTATSHRMVFQWISDQPSATHAVNLALHLVNGGLVYAIAAMVAEPPVAVAALAIFLLHPIQTEAVAYGASRSELLATAFALTALLLAMAGRRWWRSLLMWGAVAAAISAKESTVTIVPIIAILDICRGRRLAWGRIACLVLPVLGMAVSVLRWDFTRRADVSPLAYLALQATAVWRYVAIVLLPVGQSFDHDFAIVAPAIQWAALAGLLVVGVAVVGGVAYAWQAGQPHALHVRTFGLSLALVAVTPRLVIQTPELLNEHQCYLPMVGASLVLAVTCVAWVRLATVPFTRGIEGRPSQAA